MSCLMSIVDMNSQALGSEPAPILKTQLQSTWVYPGGTGHSICLSVLPEDPLKNQICDPKTNSPTTLEKRRWVDGSLVSAEVVKNCRSQCFCKRGRGNRVRFKEAKRLCELGGKRLPALSELIAISEESGVKVGEDEWVLKGLTKKQSRRGYVLEWSKKAVKRHRGRAPFRCVFEANEGQEVLALHKHSFPMSVEEPPSTPSIIRKSGEEHSWWDRDARFRKHLRKKIRLDAKTLSVGTNYHDPRQVASLLWKYHELFPESSRMFLLGYSHQGRPIWGLRLRVEGVEGTVRNQRVLINGGIHGNELMAPLYVFDSLRSILMDSRKPQSDPKEKGKRAWLEATEFWFVPLVNPDGTDHYLYASRKKKVGRKNGRNTDKRCGKNGKEGVDLNRNFPFCWGCLGEEGSKSDGESAYFRGESPGSEPETRAMMRLAESVRFTSSISWHTNGTMIISPYTIDGNQNPSPDVPWGLAERIVAQSKVQEDWREYAVKSNMYPVDGTDQDWLYHQFGTIAYIFEGSHHNPLHRTTRRRSREGANAIFESFADRLSHESTLNGRVIDEEGNGLEAEVKVIGFTSGGEGTDEETFVLYNQERWTSRPQDGLYHRLFLHAGKAKVEFSHPLYETEVHLLDVHGGQPFYEIQLSRKVK